MDLSIGILSYNTKLLLERCLVSIYKYTKDITFEIIVVDNASIDDSAVMVGKKFPRVKLIVNKENLFFAKAYNQAIAKSTGKYFMMLNSDMSIDTNAFRKMLNYMKKNKISVCEGLELYENGKVINTGSKFPTPLIDFYELSFVGKLIANKNLVNKFRMKDKSRKENFEVEVGCNAFFCVKKEILDEIKGYDENFMLYYTENDICMRIKKLGHKIYHCGEAYVYHAVAASTNQLGKKRIEIYYKDLHYYYKKNSKLLAGTLLYLILKFESIFTFSIFLNCVSERI